jgi:uncharacterized membrane protein
MARAAAESQGPEWRVRGRLDPVEYLPGDLNGLPLHPLIVHAAVVLVPLAGLLGLMMVLVPRFSRRFAPLVAGIAWAGVAVAVVAKETGEILQRGEGGASRLHIDSGDLMPAFAAAQAVLITALWLVDRRGRGVIGVLIAGLTLVAVAAAGYWVYRTGDSGAQSVWG